MVVFSERFRKRHINSRSGPISFCRFKKIPDPGLKSRRIQELSAPDHQSNTVSDQIHFSRKQRQLTNSLLE